MTIGRLASSGLKWPYRALLLIDLTVRCNGDDGLFGVLEQEPQMSIHKGDKPSDVLHKVNLYLFSLSHFLTYHLGKFKISRAR